MPASSQPSTIFTRFKETYAPLYRVLLILSSIAALMSLTEVGSIRVALDHLYTDPFYAISGIITVAAVTPAVGRFIPKYSPGLLALAPARRGSGASGIIESFPSYPQPFQE